MKKISLFLFSLLMMFSLCINVNAIGTAGDGNGGRPIIGAESDTSNWYPGLGKWQVHIGIRISFVDANGRDIQTTDYILQNAANSGNLAQYAGGHSKSHYINGYSGIDFTTSHPNLTFGSLSVLQEDFNDNNFKLSLNDYVIANWNNGTTTQSLKYAYKVNLAKDWFSKDKYTGDDYETDLKSLLNDLLGNKVNLENENELKELFMVVEPTTSIYLEGINQKGFYYGTAYELAVMANTATETNFPNGTYGTSGLTSFVTALGKNIPCSSTLDGSIYNTMSSLGIHMSGFSSSKYFRLINIVPNICNKNYLEIDELIGDYGVGMAVVWFYGLIPPKEDEKIVTCPIVNGILNVDPKSINCTNESEFKKLAIQFNDHVRNHPEEKLSEIDWQWYKNCGCKDEGGTTPSEYNCTPQYSVGTCSKKYENSVYYKDSSSGTINDEYWENCVFNDNGKYGMNTHKTSSAGDLSYLDNSLGSSRYCPVYCIEEITANFDYTDNIGAIMTGRNFVWPNNTTVTTSRTCRAKVTDEGWEKFKNEVTLANTAIEKAYYAWQFEKRKEEAYDNYTTYTKSYECPIEDCKNVNTGESEKDGVCLKITYSDGTVNDYCGRCESIGDTALQTTDYTTFKLEQFQCYKQKVKQECTTTGYNDQHVATTTYRGETWSYSWCDGDIPNPGIDVDGKKKDYDDSLKVPSSYVDEMNKCYGLTSQDIITSSPQLELNYNQGGYDYTGLLEIDDSSVPPISNAECKDVKDIPVYIASSRGTWETSYPIIYKCEKVEVTNTITQSFHINSDVYRYVLKTNQTSINASELKNYPGQNYINIGYGNLPVKFGTPTGLKENGLVITYSKLGNVESTYASQTDVDKILESLYSEDYHNWSCNYSVVDDIFEEECILGDPECPNPDSNPIPTTRGLKLIYRTIDLKNPFPDINGEGRQTGSNWCDETGYCGNDNATVVKYITSKTDIYSKEPMYTFELSPVAIKAIRSYNNSKDKNNVKRTYSDFNLICETGSGNACVSDFLDQIKEGNLNGRAIDFKAGGQCMVDSKRVSNSSEFYSCQN